jgi:uncharacterized protein
MAKFSFSMLLAMLCFFNSYSQAKNFIDQPYMELSGYADTLVVPNKIYIKITLSEKDTKDKVSVEEQETLLTNALLALNINIEQNLTTSDISSNFRSYFLKQRDILKAKDFILEVNNAELASRVFVDLENVGISNTSIQRVEHSDVNKITLLCKAKAIENALEKARLITKPLGQTVGNAISIYEPDYRTEILVQGKVAGVQVRGSSNKNKTVYEPPKIEFEKVKISANFRVVFILKPQQ